jgi:hypothetical protein
VNITRLFKPTLRSEKISRGTQKARIANVASRGSLPIVTCTLSRRLLVVFNASEVPHQEALGADMLTFERGGGRASVALMKNKESGELKQNADAT